jgi:small VCP/p97-interacting protein
MRQLQLEAAERRMRENEARGVKDVESVKRQQQKRDQLEKLERNQTRGDEGNLRVSF